MTRRHSLFNRVVPALALALTVAACGSTPKTQLYALQAAEVPLPNIGDPALAAVTIAIGPVTLPERVDRPQIVVLTGEHTVHASELNRWAEPLKAALPRQLAADLGRELGSTRVRVHGQEPGDPDLRIEVDVLRFDGVLGKEAVVEALWTLRRKGQPPRSGRSLIHERLATDGYPALVAGLGRATAALGRDLAVALRAPR